MDLLTEIKDEVDEAIEKHKIFTTVYIWNCVEKTLESRGWVHKLHPTVIKDHSYKYGFLFNKTNQQLLTYLFNNEYQVMAKRILKSNLVGNCEVDLFWFDSNYVLADYKMVPDNHKKPLTNKFKRTNLIYTTKSGLCEASRLTMKGFAKLSSPRTYDLGSELNNFWNDYNLTSAISLLRYISELHKNKSAKLISPSGQIPYEVYEFARDHCHHFVEGKSSSGDDDQVYNFGGTTDGMGWDKFQEYFHTIIQYRHHFKKVENGPSEDDVAQQAINLLQRISLILPQSEIIDGCCNIWVLKAANNQGTNIVYLCPNKASMLETMAKGTFVVQKYIERPLLIYNTKFDIRQWFLISDKDPLTIWIWKDFYLRFSSQTYTLRKLHESIHITSHLVQSKYFKSCVKDTEIPYHHTWSCGRFQEYLSDIGYPNVFGDTILPEMKNNIISATVAHKDSLGNRKSCFEIFGADFIISTDFKPWLIEIDAIPCLIRAEDEVQKLLCRCVSDAIREQKQLEIIKEEVKKAVRNKRTFTTWGCIPYRKTVEDALEKRGWVEQLHPNAKNDLGGYEYLFNKTNLKLVSLLEHKRDGAVAKKIIMSNLLKDYPVDFIWFSDLFRLEDFIFVTDLYKLPLVNKFNRTAPDYTTKSGLCESTKNVYKGIPKLSHPKTYNLKKEWNDFWKDFNITSAISLLKYVVEVHKNRISKILSPTGVIPYEAFEFAIRQCTNFIDRSSAEKNNKDHRYSATNDSMGWDQFQSYCHEMIFLTNHFKERDNMTETDESIVTQASELILKISKVWPDFGINDHRNTWILKPFNSNAGTGICVCQSRKLIVDVAKNKEFVAQKYIEHPLLIFGHKFDIRQWYLITKADPLTIWMWKEPYVRFSTETYSLRKLHEAIHLTNISIQEKYYSTSIKEAALPNCYSWTSQELEKYLLKIGYPSAFKDIIYPGMKQNIISATLMHKNSFGTRKNCYQLFGADFMVTPDFKPWLIEINQNPGMNHNTPVKAILSSRCIEDIIKIVIDSKDYKTIKRVGAFELIYKDDS